MTRLILTDAQWARIAPHCLGKASAPGRTGGDPRMFLEAALWIARTGSPWRDLPDVLGNGNTVFKRFRRGVKADVFRRISDALSGDSDLEFAVADGTIVKVHRHGRGATPHPNGATSSPPDRRLSKAAPGRPHPRRDGRVRGWRHRRRPARGFRHGRRRLGGRTRLG